MRNALACMILVLLLAGCASPENDEGKPLGEAEKPQDTRAPEKPPSNLNLSFSREFSQNEGIVTAETKFPEMPVFNFSNKTTTDGRLIVYYFMSSGCIASRELQPEIDRLQHKYPEIEWNTYDILTQNGTWAYLAFADQYGLSPDKRLVPQVLVNGSIITDRFNINASLENVITGYGAS